MKSLLIADLLIVIAFLSLSERGTQLKIDATPSEIINATDPMKGPYYIEIEVDGEKRYLNGSEALSLRANFFERCAVRNECVLNISIEANKLKLN